MPELQMDVAVANRFISSLSKSLQALCHGCMDFDTGIEIVGYINVNIDCGSKVDYVLNEKVLKSTTNSMTFVSNSFLAKKDQPKQTRDGTCSPIPELNPPPVSPFQNRTRGYFHGMHPRNVASVSHSVQRGGQKRSWAGMERDWRLSPKKQRDGRPFYPSAHESGSTAQDTHSSPSSSSHHPADSEFKYPQTSFPGSDASNVDSQSEVNIKKEFLENDNSKETDQNEQDQSQTFDQNPNDNSDQVSGVANIKRDPDASAADVDDETSAADRIDNEADDYKDTFLEPSTSEDNQAVSEHNRNESGAHDDSQTVSGGLALETSTETQENIASGSEVQGDYDEGTEEGAYPHSVYSDTGEGSSDAGQFEVIEIDDEDEDVQAMFGGPRINDSCRKQKRSFKTPQRASQQGPPILYQPDIFSSVLSDPSGTGRHIQNFSEEICSICCISLPFGVSFQQHFFEAHSQETAGSSVTDVEPFICEVCQKGFVTKERLRQHSSVHNSAFVSCFVCDVKFKHKKNIKRHMESAHGLKTCTYCLALFKVGEEFNSHILYCDGTSKLLEGTDK